MKEFSYPQGQKPPNLRNKSTGCYWFRSCKNCTNKHSTARHVLSTDTQFREADWSTFPLRNIFRQFFLCPLRLYHLSTCRQLPHRNRTPLAEQMSCLLRKQYPKQVCTTLMHGWWIFWLYLQWAYIKDIKIFHGPHVPSVP